jgi:hypothetical protein
MNDISDVPTIQPPNYHNEWTFHGAYTTPLLDADLWGTRAPTGLNISPSGDAEWSLRSISIVLNELDNTWRRSANPRMMSKRSSSNDFPTYLRLIFESHDTMLEKWIEIKVCLETWSVVVEASRE